MNRLLAIVIVCAPLGAGAYPLLAPRPIPSAIAGPADPHVAAAFYNPAALGGLRGIHFWMDGAARFHEGSIARDGGAGTATINYTDFDAFIGASFDAGDTFTFALSTMVPYDELSNFGDSAVRYYSTRQLFIDYQQSFSAAVRISNRLFLGVGATFMESWMNWHFDRDAALANPSPGVGQPPTGGFENPAAREDLRARGFGAGWNISVGILGRAADRLWLGLSYTSHTFNYHGGDEIGLVDEKGTQVKCPPGACGTFVGNSSTSIYVPDLLMAAGRIEVSSKTELEATLRWIHYGERSQLELHAQGGTLGQLPPDLALPPSSKRDLGLQDTFGAEVSARFRLGDQLRLMPSLFFETSAVESSAVNASALDAPKFDLSLTVEWKPVKHLRIGAHVGGTGYILGHVNSRQNPQDSVDCVDSQYALRPCAPVISGDGLPEASGRYTLFVVHLGAAIGVDY